MWYAADVVNEQQGTLGPQESGSTDESILLGKLNGQRGRGMLILEVDVVRKLENCQLVWLMVLSWGQDTRLAAGNDKRQRSRTAVHPYVVGYQGCPSRECCQMKICKGLDH